VRSHSLGNYLKYAQYIEYVSNIQYESLENVKYESTKYAQSGDSNNDNISDEYSGIESTKYVASTECKHSSEAGPAYVVDLAADSDEEGEEGEVRGGGSGCTAGTVAGTTAPIPTYATFTPTLLQTHQKISTSVGFLHHLGLIQVLGPKV
jgi:hypothetical protein